MVKKRSYDKCSKSSRAKWRGFLSSREGGALPLVAVTLIPLIGFIGLAVDATRGYMVKARLGEALDAAALAGAQVVFNEDDFQADIQMYFDANFPPGYMGADVTLDPPQVDAKKEVITLSASADLGTTFMQVFGQDDMIISSSSEVTRKTTSMDIVLSVDMSGSMDRSDGSGGTRIGAARGAANDLVNILFGDDATKEHLNIGLVPWTDKVNVKLAGSGSGAGSVTQSGGLWFSSRSPVPLLSEPPSNWRGCTYARYSDNEVDDDADTLLGPATIEGVNWEGWHPIGPEGETGGTSSCDTSGNWKSCPCLSHGITPLTNTKQTIKDAINDLTAPEGATNIPQGLVWAWRVLTPGVPFDQANPFPKGNHQRAIVLLTDGENHGYFGDGYSEFGNPPNDNLSVFGQGTAAGPNGMNDRLLHAAQNIKAGGIKIYAIQFYHDSGSLAELMKAVASEPNDPYYYFAPDGDALREVFAEIANHLSELRLSK
ncbi:MAG: pilus assembly protein TadG-related protein [Pseudomonadota bacterium]